MKALWLNVFLIVSAVCVSAQGEVLTVGPGGGYASINSAVAAAKTGDHIRVESGTYRENIVLDRSVTLEGVDLPIIDGGDAGSIITVIADGCKITGFDVRNSGNDLRAEDAGILLKSNGNIVEDNVLSKVLFGIYLLQSGSNAVRRNTIVGRKELEPGERGAGLHLWNSPKNILEDNVVTFARDGMYIQNSSNNQIRRNRVSDLRYGLHFMNSDDDIFEDNVFFDNVAGAAIMYSKNIELRRNAFVHNRGFSSFGILFQDCRQCVTEENLILNNATGIFLEGLKNSVFRRNTIAENDLAAEIFASSVGNVFSENNFINNLSPLQLVGKGGNTEWKSNFWSDYQGYDLDGDAYGDVPHKIQNIFEYLEGNFPRVRIYLNSPAAGSIVAAERSFPIVKGSNEFDSAPLMRPVDIGVSFRPEKSGGAAKWSALAFSIVLLGISIFTFKRGFAG